MGVASTTTSQSAKGFSIGEKMSKTSKSKPCPHPNCDRLIDKRSEFCKKHRIITPKIRDAIRIGKEKIGWVRVSRTCQNPDCKKQFTTPKGEATKGVANIVVGNVDILT